MTNIMLQTEENKMGRGDYGWWMEQFKNADDDQNAHLTLEELKEYYFFFFFYSFYIIFHFPQFKFLILYGLYF